MYKVVMLMTAIGLGACEARPDEAVNGQDDVTPASLVFDGSDYNDEGQRSLMASD